MAEVHEGGCLCGAVRYVAKGPPLRTLVCHCRFCQKVTGSTSYAESLFRTDAIEFSDAPMGTYDHTSAGSGRTVHVHFCPTCGTTIGLTFDRWPEFRAISRGTLDDPNRVAIGSHIWTESAQTGVVLPPDTDCFRGARARLDGTPETPERHAGPTPARREG